MSTRLLVCRSFLLLSFALASASQALAQETTGSIAGFVKDPSGLAVPGAKIEISSPSLVRPLQSASDGNGNFQFQSLPPGSYFIVVTAAGFRAVKENKLPVTIGRTSTVEIKLEVGMVSETVVINAAVAQIDTTSSTSTVSVTREFFDKMPKSRSFDGLIALAPGTRAESKSGQYSIDGASGSENAWIIDGVERTNIRSGTLGGSAQVPFEFIQEVEVKSSGFEAQYPATTGGVVNAVTRSGGNDFHGQVGTYFNSNDTQAGPRPTLRLNPLDTTQNSIEYFRNTQDPFRTLGPVFSLGGRIVRNKAWFFAGWSPTFSRTRRVTTLFDDPTKTPKEWETKSRRDYLTTKVDYAPLQKLRGFVSYLYSPTRTNGNLPAQDGTSRSNTPWTQLGSRSPAANYNWSATWTPLNKMVVNYHGGYVYTNTKSYGVPNNIYYQFLNSSINLAGVPSNLQAPSGNFTPSTNQTAYDKQNRQVHYVDVDYLFTAFGQHNVKGGYSRNQLGNDVFVGYPNGYFRIGWNQQYTGVTVPGFVRGTYGYYMNRVIGTTGNVGSTNEGLYLQDNWKVNRRLALNLGIRFDREFVPSFRTDNGAKSRAIEWGFFDKAAPRLGFAYDILGNAKWTLRGGYGRLFDQFKYELPRGSFGGDIWLDFVYPLNDPDITKLSLTNTPGTLFERLDQRLTSNDPTKNLIDPILAPMRKHYWNLMSEYQLNAQTVLSARYTRNRLDRAIEDVGLLTSLGEQYFIANPGYGVTANAKNFPAGFPTTPKAVMNYDALELRTDKRFSNNFLYSVSYTYSRLWGNYSGLASSDENGRTSPNVDRNFDLPWEKYDAKGQPVMGLLATDRPHTFKLFGSYSVKSKVGSTSLSPIFIAYSGLPMSTTVGVISLPIQVNGRGDLGRTPVHTNLDLQLGHDLRIPKMKEGWRVRIQADMFNTLNQNIETNRFAAYNHGSDGNLQFPNQSDVFKGFDYKALMTTQKKRVDPRFGLSNGWNSPRSARMGIHLIF